MLFAWGAWKLPFTAALAHDPALAAPWPEDLRLFAAVLAVQVVAGAALLRAVTGINK
jgi:hypothetical protein